MRRVLGTAIVTAWMVVLAGTGWADMGKTAPALKAAPGSKAEAHLKEGIEHYDQGHFDVALKHFMAGAKEDPQSAEAHYDVALALDKTGDHIPPLSNCDLLSDRCLCSCKCPDCRPDARAAAIHCHDTPVIGRTVCQ